MTTTRDVLVWVGRSSKRIAVTLVGSSLITLGLVLLVLPGPGLLVIVAGFAVLATQYTWARRALEVTKRHASKATKRLRRSKPSGGASAG